MDGLDELDGLDWLVELDGLDGLVAWYNFPLSFLENKIDFYRLESTLTHQHVYSVQFARVFCTVCTGILYSLHVYSVQLTRVFCTVYTCILYSLHVYSVQFTRVHCTLYSV